MNILIATDGSEYSGHALDFSLRFSFPPGSTMTVLSVVDDIPMLPAELDALDETQSKDLKAAYKGMQEDAQELVDRESARLRADGWQTETIVRNGKPVDQILRVAEEIDADLIVVGSHGMNRAQRFMLGSVSDRVLEYASCSVVIVKKRSGEASPESIKLGANAAQSIMLAYDVSDVSSEALKVCASFPLEEQSQINVVNVMPLITAYRQDVRQHINSIWMQKKIIMQAELDKAVKSLQWATPNLTTQLREASNVSAEILSAAEEAGSDLIMVGCKDKSPLQRFLLGSITHRMARYADCTVWAVRKKTGTA